MSRLRAGIFAASRLLPVDGVVNRNNKIAICVIYKPSIFVVQKKPFNESAKKVNELTKHKVMLMVVYIYVYININNLFIR